MSESAIRKHNLSTPQSREHNKIESRKGKALSAGQTAPRAGEKRRDVYFTAPRITPPTTHFWAKM